MRRIHRLIAKELFEAWYSGTWTLLWCTAYDRMYLGGKVEKADRFSEYGKTEVMVDKKDSTIIRKCI